MSWVFKTGVEKDFEVGKKYKSIQWEWVWSGYRLLSPTWSQLMTHGISNQGPWSLSCKLQEFIKGFYISLEGQLDSLHIPFAPGTILSNLSQLTHFLLTTSLWNRCCYYLSSFIDEETDVQRNSTVHVIQRVTVSSGRNRIQTLRVWIQLPYPPHDCVLIHSSDCILLSCWCQCLSCFT